jgi:RHS repeat-associated protein
LWLDDWFASTDSTGSVALLRDALRSTIALVNGAGSLATLDTYEPFGKTTTSGSSSTNPYAFVGRELDASGLYFMRARYYNPLLSRFISSDPIGLAGGQPNFYAYAYNSPMNFVDPMGLSGSAGPGELQAPKPPPPHPMACDGGDCKVQGRPNPHIRNQGLILIGGGVVAGIIGATVGAFGPDEAAGGIAATAGIARAARATSTLLGVTGIGLFGLSAAAGGPGIAPPTTPVPTVSATPTTTPTTTPLPLPTTTPTP